MEDKNLDSLFEAKFTLKGKEGLYWKSTTPAEEFDMIPQVKEFISTHYVEKKVILELKIHLR